MSAQDIFGTNPYTTYQVELQFTGVVVGGIPSDENVRRTWLRRRLELDDAKLNELADQMAVDKGIVSIDAKVDSLMKTDIVSVNCFRRDPVTGELCVEGRILKAALKEAWNVAYPGVDFPGKPKRTGRAGKEVDLIRKGLMKFSVERVFVPETLVGLGVKEPTRVEERIKHVETAQGPRSAINHVEVVEKPRIQFTVQVLDDLLTKEVWGKVWSVLENIGIGSDRARSDGKFTLETWKKVS